jgi:hypothetical protein
VEEREVVRIVVHDDDPWPTVFVSELLTHRGHPRAAESLSAPGSAPARTWTERDG